MRTSTASIDETDGCRSLDEILDRICGPAPAHAERCWHIENRRGFLEHVCSKSMWCPRCRWEKRRAQLKGLLEKMADRNIYAREMPETAGAYRAMGQRIKLAGHEYVSAPGVNVTFSSHDDGTGRLVPVDDLPTVLWDAITHIPEGKRLRPSEGWYLYAPPRLTQAVDSPGELDEFLLTETVVDQPKHATVDMFEPLPDPDPVLLYDIPGAELVETGKQLGYEFQAGTTWDGRKCWDARCLPPIGSPQRQLWVDLTGEHEASWSIARRNAA